jgi:Down syndrome cell adhesion protein
VYPFLPATFSTHACVSSHIFPGYLINYKREGGDWEEYESGPKTTDHVLQSLACGSTYQVFITAFNKIGSGLPSDILTRNTKGSGEFSEKQ